MNRRLGNKPVRCRYAEQAREERCQAEQRKVVMESRELTQQELRALDDQRLYTPTVNSNQQRVMGGSESVAWRRCGRRRRMDSNGSASATHFPSSCQKGTSQERRSGHVQAGTLT